MIQKILEERFKRIFKIELVTFDLPNEHQEQEKLFVQIDQVRTNVKEDRQVSRVNGRALMFAQAEKMPHGYFSRCIAQASNADTKDLFFGEVDQSSDTYRNIDVRSFGFIFFHSEQYDPEKGTLNQVNTNIEVKQ